MADSRHSTFKTQPTPVERLLIAACLGILLSLIPSHIASRVAGQDSCQPTEGFARIEGEEIAELVRNGERVLLDGRYVCGGIDLTDTKSVAEPLVLTNSVIDGSVIVPFTVFETTVDLTNTRIQGALDSHGSIFRGSFHFSGTSGTTAQAGSIDARTVQFTNTADLRGIEVFGRADFQDASFEGRALFQLGIFNDAVAFDRAVFSGEVDILRTQFFGDVSLEEAAATADIDLSGSAFHATATFRRMSVAGTLQLEAATLNGTVSFDKLSAHELILIGATFATSSELHMTDVRIDQLRMDLADVEKIQGTAEQRTVLKKIEATARDAGDAEIANDASYERNLLETDEMPPAKRWLSLVFERAIAGYLVRPLHPLRFMAAILVMGILARLAMDFRSNVAKPRKERQNWAGWWASLLLAIGGALSVAVFPKIPDTELSDADRSSWRAVLLATGRWAEWLAQKSLNVLVLIATANTSPAVKDLVDSIFKI